MGEPRRVRYWGYVERPLDQVQALLHSGPLELIQRATVSAARRTEELMAHLKVGVGPVEIGADVRTHVDQVREEAPLDGSPRVTVVDLHWESARAPKFFPLMRAELSVWPISSTETVVVIDGEYTPPLGFAGSKIDALFGHRIAEASVQRLLEDTLEQIRGQLSS
jgi:hypothetical protein